MENFGALQVIILALFAMFISYAEERFGSFQGLEANWKQVANSILAVVLPSLLAWSQGWWRPEFGDAAQVWTQLAYLVIPIGAWLVTQITHQADRILQNTGNQGQFKTLKK